MQELDLLNLFIAPLEKHEIAYAITGSVASMYYGEPRMTHDIDILFLFKPKDLNTIISIFPLESFYCPPIEVMKIENTRTSHAHFNLIHHETGLKADCYPVSQNPLHHFALRNKNRVRFSDGIHVWIAPIEYVMIRKLQFFLEGNSQKHITDIQNMIEVSEQQINKEVFAQLLKDHHLTDIWKSILPSI